LQELLFNQLHPEWQDVLAKHRQSIGLIENRLSDRNIAPSFDNIFRALTRPPSLCKVVIFGQDPYPGVGQANGFAFSVEPLNRNIPASLRNIFKELSSDLEIAEPSNGDLTHWSEQGVLLLNRILSTDIGSSLSHRDYGWQEITDSVAQYLGGQKVVAILWGKNASELSRFFATEWIVSSVHPSPLSAYRGFFGSKPFTHANQILVNNGIPPVMW